MTAIVGILNKKAAVMAADSAVTVINGKGAKIYNTATKIFSLSDEHLIGVMIYNSLEFMETPWDLIFSLYKKELGGKECKSVQEYAETFVRFLKNKDYFCHKEATECYLLKELSAYYAFVKETAFSNERWDEDDSAKVLEKLKKAISYITSMSWGEGVCDDFKGYKESKLLKISDDIFEDLEDALKEEQLPTDIMDDLQHGFFEYIRSKVFFQNTTTYTGIVFVGYGEKEIFPSLFPVIIGGVVDNRLKCNFDVEHAESITYDNSAYIAPFAQGDVMLTMMKGIAPYLYTSITEEVQLSMKKAIRKFASRQGITDEKKVAREVEYIVDKFQKEFEENLEDIIIDQYTSGIVDTVRWFNVEDMVNMAESLISITNLQRHITSSEESVGGPTDVAVITKTGGFQWIKHKK